MSLRKTVGDDANTIRVNLRPTPELFYQTLIIRCNSKTCYLSSQSWELLLGFLYFDVVYKGTALLASNCLPKGKSKTRLFTTTTNINDRRRDLQLFATSRCRGAHFLDLSRQSSSQAVLRKQGSILALTAGPSYFSRSGTEAIWLNTV